MKGLIKLLSICFTLVAFLLVAIVTITNRLPFLVIIKRSLLAAVFFGFFGGLLGYLVINLTTNGKLKSKGASNKENGMQHQNKTEQQMNSVSRQTAAQQYTEQSQEIEGKGQEDESEFQPLNLEEIDYQELEEADELKSQDELAEQDPEQLAQMIKSMKDS